MATGLATGSSKWTASVCVATVFLLVCLIHIGWTDEYAPASTVSHMLKTRRSTCESAACKLFLKQMRNPSEMFTVLLIIGGDVVQKAIAQQTGVHKVTLVPFSFGWVACAFSALLSAFGDGTFMPQPDYPSIVIDIESRNKKSNGAWIIGRLIRDLEWDVEHRLKHNKTRLNTGLLVTIWKMDGNGAGKPQFDWLYWSFYGTVLVQFVIATIPIYAFPDSRNWSIALITGVGTLFAILTGSLKAWRKEKFGSTLSATDPLGPYDHLSNERDYILTRGNGHKHVFVLRHNAANHGVRLYDLAGAVSHATTMTRCWAFLNAVLWIMFLLVAGGLDEHTWFLFGVGAVGMLQNIMAAGFSRKTKAHGIPLTLTATRFGENDGKGRRPKVMKVLFELTQHDINLGRSLRPEFFPDISLSTLERTFWNTLEETNDCAASKTEVMKKYSQMQNPDRDAKRTVQFLDEVWP